ncbi:hypothetical protein Sjap_013080 [Stephania japonica]|uniref:Uncharacterized protein n=1 Tax=Stephania japonica TaxID=461633 RepID=A0AAP0IXG0_9MAGN
MLYRSLEREEKRRVARVGNREKRDARERDKAGEREGDEEANQLGVVRTSSAFRAQGDGSEPREQGNQEAGLRKRDQDFERERKRFSISLGLALQIVVTIRVWISDKGRALERLEDRTIREGNQKSRLLVLLTRKSPVLRFVEVVGVVIGVLAKIAGFIDSNVIYRGLKAYYGWFREPYGFGTNLGCGDKVGVPKNQVAGLATLTTAQWAIAHDPPGVVGGNLGWLLPTEPPAEP